VTISSSDWGALFQKELPRIYNYFLYRLNEKSTAEDLASATFVRAWKSRDLYRQDIASFSTWLFTIAHRVAIDYFRKHQAKIVALDDIPELMSDGSPEASYQETVEKLMLGNAIAALPEREQDIISLKYGAELSNKEIAALLQLSESNVSTILHRTVKQLRGILMQQGELNHE
jgi:RNA polymerase sigma-70 factor, ECF subfamily